MCKEKKEKGLVKAIGNKVLFLSDELKEIAKEYGRSNDEILKIFIVSLVFAAKTA